MKNQITHRRPDMPRNHSRLSLHELTANLRDAIGPFRIDELLEVLRRTWRDIIKTGTTADSIERKIYQEAIFNRDGKSACNIDQLATKHLYMLIARAARSLYRGRFAPLEVREVRICRVLPCVARLVMPEEDYFSGWTGYVGAANLDDLTKIDVPGQCCLALVVQRTDTGEYAHVQPKVRRKPCRQYVRLSGAQYLTKGGIRVTGD